MYSYNRPLGLILTVLGFVLFLYAAGPFLFNISLAFLALSLINHGLRMQGKPPLLFWAQSWFRRF